MKDFFKLIEDTDEVRQGDIIRQLHPQTGALVKLGVVITADCDIANKKAGDRYTWLEILPMVDYIKGPWAQEQLRKLCEKRSKSICQYLTAQARKQQPDLAEVTSDSLVEWLRSSTPAEILTRVTGQAPAPNAKQLHDLQGFALTVIPEESRSAFSRLQAAWNLFGTDEKAQHDNLRNAFKDGGGFQDYFVLPELPGLSGLGFVVMLRSMWNLMAPELYLTVQDARINDKPGAFHRLGRLNDGIRFSITQKLAFLYSRIGMPTDFESACETATEIAVEELFKKTIRGA